MVSDPLEADAHVTLAAPFHHEGRFHTDTSTVDTRFHGRKAGPRNVFIIPLNSAPHPLSRYLQDYQHRCTRTLLGYRFRGWWYTLLRAPLTRPPRPVVTVRDAYLYNLSPSTIMGIDLSHSSVIVPISQGVIHAIAPHVTVPPFFYM